MTIKPPLSSRLIIGLGGIAGALCFGFITLYGLLWQHEPLSAAGFVMVGVFGLVAYYWGRPASLEADDNNVAYHPPLGRPRVCSRSDLGSIDRVWGGRLYHLELTKRDGTVLLTLDHSYPRVDIERLASYLGVPLRWDGSTP